MPSLFPSIWVPGQFLRKYVASAQEVICEQCVRPSHRNWLGAAWAGRGIGDGAACSTAGARLALQVWYFWKPAHATRTRMTTPTNCFMAGIVAH